MPGLSQADSPARAVGVIFANPRTLVRNLAGAIIAKEHFARNGSGVLYAYRGGVYRPDGEMLIRQRVKHRELSVAVRKLQAVALRDPVMPVADGFFG